MNCLVWISFLFFLVLFINLGYVLNLKNRGYRPKKKVKTPIKVPNLKSSIKK